MDHHVVWPEMTDEMRGLFEKIMAVTPDRFNDFTVSTTRLARFVDGAEDDNPLHQFGANALADRAIVAGQMFQTLVLHHAPVRIPLCHDDHYAMITRREEDFLRPLLVDTPARMHCWPVNPPKRSRKGLEFCVSFKTVNGAGKPYAQGSYWICYMKL